MKTLLQHIQLFIALCSIAMASQSFAACPGSNVNFSVNQSFFCGTGPYTLNFNNTSSGSFSAAAGFDWYENGVLIGSTNNVASPFSQTITNVGTYTYLLVLTDPTVPCSDSATLVVTVAPAPNAGFSFAPNNQCAFQEVQFSNTSTGTNSNSTYSWDFGPGPNSSLEHPTNTFNSSGTYAVTLTVDNGPGCQSTVSQNVTIIDAPNAIISGDDGDGDLVYCLFPGDNTTSETVTFSNATTNATSYTWDFGDGSPLFTTNSLSNFTHTYSSYGTFTVTMTASHPNGCQTTDTLEVIFEKFVSAALTLNLMEYSGCAPHTMSTLTNLSVNANTYVWDFGDGSTFTTSSPVPPNYAYTSAGSYTITLTASNSCNSATATISPIIIIDGPSAAFSPSITNGCAPQTVSFSNSSSDVQPANNYQWDMGNGNTYTSTGTPPAQVYDTTGSYDITLIAGNACGYDTLVQSIFIDTIPTVDLEVNPITGCAPLNVDPTATLNSGINVNWQWYVDGVYAGNTPFDIANQNFGSNLPNDSTLHTIQVNVYNNCGNDNDLDSVYVHPPVVALFSAPDTICLGEIAAFTNTSTGTELSYSWDFGDGSPLETAVNPTHTYSTSGDFTVSITVSGKCGTEQFTQVVSVLDLPVIDITPLPSAICSGESVSFLNNSSTNGNYFWNFGANASIPSSSLYDPGSIVLTGSGNQQISFSIDYGGCVSSDTVTVDVNPIPVPQFNVSPLSGCTPLDVAINNTTIDEPGLMYSWSYGNGTSSTGILPVNPTYSASSNDTSYTIQLVIESQNGCIDSLAQIVTVHPLPNAIFTILDDTVCLGTPMLFANNSTGASNYLWDFGDGTTSTTISPSHTYSGVGSFTVTMVAYSSSGCSDTVSTSIFIDSIPLPTFTNSIECFGNTTIFTNTSTGSPVSYVWDFGDGTPADTSTHPSHLYSASGSYLVSLTATNSVYCSNSISQLVQVNEVPVADFGWSPTCEGQNMNFTDLSLNTPIGWAWDFGDGNTALVQHPSHVYVDTGSFTVQLIVSGGSGCLDSIEMQVYVDSIPQANFSFDEACSNDLTSFSDSSLYNPDTYFWQFGDGGVSSATTPSHTYTNAGTYPVTLTVTYASSGCSHSITQNVEAFPRTVPAFTANTPCLGEFTDFVDATSNLPVTWEWDFGDGSPIDTSASPSHLYATQGIYVITLITSNSYGCYDTLNQSVEIYGLPIADFFFDTVCEGAVSSFFDSSTDDASWEWDFGDGSPIVLMENPSHTFSVSGTYTVTLVVNNAVGCSDTIAYPVTVNPNPMAGFVVDTACFGYTTSFTDTSQNSIAWSYNLGDGSVSSVSNPTHVYPLEGTYMVQQVVTNVFGCSDSIVQPVVIYPQPQAGFFNTSVCAQDVVDFTDTTWGNISTWNWNFGDSSGTATVQNPTYIYATGGNYDVTLIAGNTVGCLDTVTMGIDVYTNPVAEFEADTVCFLDVTHFVDLSTDVVPIVSWEYDFGDGINQSTLQHPTYIYQVPGVYPATLTVTNIHGCDSTFGFNVVVNNIPVAEFSYDTVCWGSPTHFQDISSGSVNAWNWDFGDGNTSGTGPNVDHTYANAGSYLASMEVDGGAGCTDIVFHAVTVLDVLTPQIGAQDTACLMEPVQFSDLSITNSGTISGWSWDFGDGNTSNVQNPIHAYANPGVYTITLDVQTSTGCTNTGTFNITVFDPPQNYFSFTIPCEGQPTLFTDSSYDQNGTVTNWWWDFGDGSPIDNNASPQHQYSTAGNYNVVSIIQSSNGCFDTLTQVVTIYPSPTADFQYSLECGGEPISFLDASNGTIIDYQWSYNGSTFSTQQNPVQAFPTLTDTHSVTLVVTTDLGCVDSITQLVTTHPVVLFDFGPLVTAGCPVLEVQFNDNSTTTGGGGIVNWLWDMGDSTYSFSSDPIHFYEDEGTYYVSLEVITAEDCHYFDTLTYAVIVYPQPTADFIYSPSEITTLHPEVEFTNTSIGAQDVEWHFGDFEYSNDWDPVHSYLDTGSFEVTQIVYNAYGCSDTISKWLSVKGTLVVYLPNSFTPNGDGLNDLFMLNGYGFESFELHIFNRWGEIVKTITDPSDYWDGTYRGALSPIGTYTWKLRVVDFDEIPHVSVGHVSLLR